MQTTPYTIPLLIAALVCGAVSAYAWSRRRVPGSRSFSLLMAGVALWCAGYAAEIALPDLASKLAGAKFQYLGVASVATLWLLFAMEYTGLLRPPGWGGRLVLGTEPAVCLVLALTNELHGWIWADIELDRSLGFAMLRFDYGTFFWAHAAYSYVLLLVGVVIFMRAAMTLPRFGRRQAALLVVAALAPWAGNVLYLGGVNPFPLLDLTPFGFTVTGLAIAWTMRAQRFLRIVPVAHQAIVAGMRDGVLAVDVEGRVVETNRAAQRILGVGRREVEGRAAAEVLVDHPGIVERLAAILILEEPESARAAEKPEVARIAEEPESARAAEERESARAAEEPESAGAVAEASEAPGDRLRAEWQVDGVRRSFDVRLSLMRNEADTAVGCLLTLHDVTAQVRAQRQTERAREAAENASRAKSEFLANMSHEIRTPMNAVIGMIDLVLETELDDEQRDHLATAEAAAHSLLRIIDDILDVSRIETGRLELEAVPFDLERLTTESVRMLRGQAHEKGLTIQHRIAPGVPRWVRGDAGRLRQVLVNLLANAVKFTRRGTVRLEVVPERLRKAEGDAETGSEAAVRFRVVDTGVGIDAAARTRIFRSFEQADTSVTRTHGGTGLGLTISSELVRLMGSRIELDTEVGKGSTFSFAIRFALPGDDVVADLEAGADPGSSPPPWQRPSPAVRLPGPEAARAAAAGSEGGVGAGSPQPRCAGDTEESSSGERPVPSTGDDAVPDILAPGDLHLLVVEDNAVNQMVARRILERRGYRVTVAGSAAEALELFEGGGFDAVLMDIEMPGMSGAEASEAIRARGDGASTVTIVALTAHDDAAARRRCREAGMDAHVAKPIEAAALYRILDDALARRRGSAFAGRRGDG